MKKNGQVNFTHEKNRPRKFQNRGDTMLKRGYYVKEGTMLKRKAPNLLNRGATILKSIWSLAIRY